MDEADRQRENANPTRDEKPGTERDSGEQHKNGAPSKQGQEAAKDQNEQSGKKPLPRWPLVLAGILVVAFVVLVLFLIFRPRPNVWTDDAYVTVHYAMIAPRISGQVSTVPVDDNQVVKAGDVLATLDPRDNQTAVASAEAALARDRAQTGEASADVARQPPIIEEQRAAVASASARLAFAQADASRYHNLA